MAKASTLYVCQQCDFQSSSFLGKCPECGAWNSLVETIVSPVVGGSIFSGQKSNNKKRVINLPDIINLVNVEKKDYSRLSTQIGEFDRCLGGGIVNGSVVLISGDPGIGKSTLLTQLAININQSSVVSHQSSDSRKTDGSSVLYIAGEESAQQIKLRVDRINKDANLAVLNEVDVDLIVSAIDKLRPKLAIIDSIQTLETQDLNSIAGSVGQVRECAHRLQRAAKDLHIPLFIVGHVTKEGTVAGPKTLEHLVDVVLQLEGDSATNFRTLRGIKNRFGPTDEVGIFEMEEYGLKEVLNPSKIFLDQKVNAPGSVVVPIVNGMRSILVEIQALVTKSFLPVPRRVGTGIDNNRLQLLVAVLAKRLNLPLYETDVYVNVTGGIKVSEPAADLGVCMAIVSSLKDKPVGAKTAFVGEIGLLGELRNVRQLDKRKNEATKLGFTKIISPENAKSLNEAVKMGIAF